MMFELLSCVGALVNVCDGSPTGRSHPKSNRMISITPRLHDVVSVDPSVGSTVRLASFDYAVSGGCGHG